MENAREHLMKFGVKPSIQRLAIMKYLLSHKTHPTADEIYNSLFTQIPTLSKTTVYNTLKLLAERGAALSLGVDERNIRYDGDVTPHAHFICTNCGKVFDFGADNMSKVLELVDLQKMGYSISDIQLNCKGLCPNCNKA